MREKAIERLDELLSDPDAKVVENVLIAVEFMTEEGDRGYVWAYVEPMASATESVGMLTRMAGSIDRGEYES